MYSFKDLEGSYVIGPPHETVSICRGRQTIYDFDGGPLMVESKGCTTEELEKMNYRGIYKCFV